jgi:hypothetical protein
VPGRANLRGQVFFQWKAAVIGGDADSHCLTFIALSIKASTVSGN